MEIVKVTQDYTIIKKKSGRYGVRRPNRHWVNGPEKVEILLKEGLIKAPSPKAQAPAEEETQEEGAEAEDSAQKEEEGEQKGDSEEK